MTLATANQPPPSSTLEKITREWNKAIAPPSKLDILDWCEKHIIIPRRSGTPFPGPYDISLTPWVRGWFEAIQDTRVKTIAIMKGAQVGATQTCYNALCYWVCEDPDPILVVMPSRDEVKDASKLRIQPIIEDTPRLKDELSEAANDFNLTEYKFKRTFARLIGSNSPSKLASFAHRFLILDETDKYKETLKKEGSVIGLASQRSKLFWNRLMIALSTPTTKAGYIYRMYLDGDQRKLFVSCPHCKHKQVLTWQQVKFNSKLPVEEAGQKAYYECEQCKGAMYDADKQKLVSRGEWIPTSQSIRDDYVSFHLPGLYSFSDECSFKALTIKFLTVKKDKAALQDFINSDLGEIWEEQSVEKFEQKMIYEIRDRNIYERGTIPTTLPVFLVCIVDVQKNYVEWAVWALRPHDSWLVDHGTASVLDDIDKIAAGPYYNEDGKAYPCSFQVVDSGYRTTEVYRYCLKRKTSTLPIKGERGMLTKQTQPIQFNKIEKYPDGKPMRGSLILRHIHPNYFKNELIAAVNAYKDDDGADIPTDNILVRLHFHREIDKAYVDQITGEVPLEDKPDKFGGINIYYKKIRANNQFDLAQYMFAVRWMCRRDLALLEAEEAGTVLDVEKQVDTVDTKEQPAQQVTYEDEDEDEW